MTPYQAFLRTPNRNDEWVDFVCDLPQMLFSDNNVQRLFKDYPFLVERKDEVFSDFEHEFIHELQYWAFYQFKEEYSEKMLYETIYNTSASMFADTLFKFIPIDFIQVDTPLSQSPRLDDIKNQEAEIDLKLAQDDNDKDEIYLTELQKKALQQIRLRAGFGTFGFSKRRILKLIREWEKNKIQKNRVKIYKPYPIIKIVDYFDPTIYNVIKKNPELLKTLDWRIFEEMLADILRRLKYEVELTKPTKDGGIDIIAIKKDENFGNHKYLLQAKRYQDAVQVSPVRELLFLHDEFKATKSCLATTATFSKGAWKLAEIHKWKLELKDQNGILNWIDKIEIDPTK